MAEAELGEEFEGLFIGGEPFAVGRIGEDVAGLGKAVAFSDQHRKGGLVALHLFEGGVENLRPFDDDRRREGAMRYIIRMCRLNMIQIVPPAMRVNSRAENRMS